MVYLLESSESLEQPIPTVKRTKSANTTYWEGAESRMNLSQDTNIKNLLSVHRHGGGAFLFA